MVVGITIGSAIILKNTLKEQPLPESHSTSILPPDALTIFRIKYNPMPVPSAVSLTRLYFLKIWSISSFVMPIPLSVIDNTF